MHLFAKSYAQTSQSSIRFLYFFRISFFTTFSFNHAVGSLSSRTRGMTRKAGIVPIKKGTANLRTQITLRVSQEVRHGKCRSPRYLPLWPVLTRHPVQVHAVGREPSPQPAWWLHKNTTHSQPNQEPIDHKIQDSR